MTKMGRVIREVSDLRDFYIQLQRIKRAGTPDQGKSTGPSQEVGGAAAKPESVRQDNGHEGGSGTAN